MGTSTHNLCFEQKYDKYQNFLSEHFLVVKCSVYLNRRVFVMQQKKKKKKKTLFIQPTRIRMVE